MNDTREAAFSVVSRTLAADCGCDEKAFELDGISSFVGPKNAPTCRPCFLEGPELMQARLLISLTTMSFSQ